VRDWLDNIAGSYARTHGDYYSFGTLTNTYQVATNGTTVTVVNAMFNIQYTGQIWDSYAGLYNYKARWYDSATGRFFQQDPIEFAAGDANLYRYVGNGPTNATDPTGYLSDDEKVPPDPPVLIEGGDGACAILFQKVNILKANLTTNDINGTEKVSISLKNDFLLKYLSDLNELYDVKDKKKPQYDDIKPTTEQVMKWLNGNNLPYNPQGYRIDISIKATYKLQRCKKGVWEYDKYPPEIFVANASASKINNAAWILDPRGDPNWNYRTKFVTSILNDLKTIHEKLRNDLMDSIIKDKKSASGCKFILIYMELPWIPWSAKKK
jgi:RHS repeat-associated protein